MGGLTLTRIKQSSKTSIGISKIDTLSFYLTTNTFCQNNELTFYIKPASFVPQKQKRETDTSRTKVGKSPRQEKECVPVYRLTVDTTDVWYWTLFLQD